MAGQHHRLDHQKARVTDTMFIGGGVFTREWELGALLSTAAGSQRHADRSTNGTRDAQ